MAYRLLLLIVLTAAWATPAQGVTCAAAAARTELSSRRNDARERVRFVQVESARSFSKFLRSNARHYWAWSRENAVAALGPFLRHVGLIVGDMHMNNLAFVKLNGRLKFKVNDFDDGGHGPFVLDLAHHIITTRAVNDSIRRREFAEAYLSGLRTAHSTTGERPPLPELVRKTLELSPEKLHRLEDEYADRKTDKKGRLKTAKDEINELPRRLREQLIEAIEEVVTPATVIDVVELVREHGGSAGMQRYLAVVENSRRRQIIEFKQIAEPATGAYRPQPAPVERYRELVETFWGGLSVRDARAYGVVELSGASYWMRPKGLSLLDIPYSSQSKKARKFVRELSLYQAFVLGQLHGSQATGGAYWRAVERDFESFYAGLQEFTKVYEQIAKQAYEH